VCACARGGGGGWHASAQYEIVAGWRDVVTVDNFLKIFCLIFRCFDIKAHYRLGNL
jgi:hypothetical protein